MVLAWDAFGDAKAALAVNTANAAAVMERATLFRALLLARRRTVLDSLRYFTFTFGGGCNSGRAEMLDCEKRP